MLVENRSRRRAESSAPPAIRWIQKRPFLLLFLALLVVFTLMGANRVAAASGPVTRPTSSSVATEPPVEKPKIYIHVVGEVVHPGLYLLLSGSRLAEAIALAGGFTHAAEQASVNLARILNDGEQIVVLNKADYASGVGGGSNASSAVKKVSLNRSSQSELEALPRVGPALAARIVDWRTANGGFKSVQDLTKVSGFGDKMFAAVKDQVTL